MMYCCRLSLPKLHSWCMVVHINTCPHSGGMTPAIVKPCLIQSLYNADSLFGLILDCNDDPYVETIQPATEESQKGSLFRCVQALLCTNIFPATANCHSIACRWWSPNHWSGFATMKLQVSAVVTKFYHGASKSSRCTILTRKDQRERKQKG